MKFNPTPLQELSHSIFDCANVQVHVKRYDLIHSFVSGNKLFKLKYHLKRALKQGAKTLVTFGGAYSNHLHATAFAAREAGVDCVGVIRGQQILPLNHTLKDCVHQGMTLEPVTRLDYQDKDSSLVIQNVLKRYEKPYLIPEGGGGELGVLGAQDMLTGIDQSQFDVMVVACGTGATLAGLINGANPSMKIVGVPVLKGAEKWMDQEVASYLKGDQNNWELFCEYHFGGYGKWDESLLEFIYWSDSELKLPLDQVYTGKAFFGLVEKIKKGYWKAGTRILFVHTGGLQGRRSLQS